MMGYEQILNEYNDILLPTDVQKILHTGRNTVYTYLAEGKCCRRANLSTDNRRSLSVS